MEAAVLKLGHPLEEIRLRSLRSIHTKITMGLWPHPHKLPVKIQHLLMELLPSLAPDYSPAQDILTQLQAVNTTPHSTETKCALNAPRAPAPRVAPTDRPMGGKSIEATVAPPRPDVPSSVQSGWTFSHVQLCDADDQLLFEFEVKLKMHGNTKEGLRLFIEFGETMLRDFPAEVFLQRPAILQYLLHLLQLPLIELNQPPPSTSSSSSSPCFGEVFFGYTSARNNRRRHPDSALFFVLLGLLEDLVAGLSKSFQLHMDASYHSQVVISLSRSKPPPLSSSHPLPSYPCAGHPRRDHGGIAWSYSGAMCHVFKAVASLLTRPLVPRLHVLGLLLPLIDSLRDVSAATDAIDSFELDRLGECFAVLMDALDDSTSPDDHPSAATTVYYYTWQVLVQMLTSMGTSNLVLPPRLLQTVQNVVFDQALYDVAPSYRHKLLPIVASVNPHVDNLLEQHISTMDIVKNWPAFVRHVDQVVENDQDVEDNQLPQQALAILSVLDHVRPIDASLAVLTAAAKTLRLVTDDDTLFTNLLSALLLAHHGAKTSSHFQDVAISLEASRSPAAAIPASIVVCVCRLLVDTPPPQVDSLWRILKHVLPSADQSAVPFLQHWAYADTPQSPAHQHMQPVLAAKLRDMQGDFAQSVVGMARCLLHTSEFVRRSASVGLASALVDDCCSYVEQRDWMVQPEFTPGDPFHDLLTPLRHHVATFKLPWHQDHHPSPPSTLPPPLHQNKQQNVLGNIRKLIAMLQSPSLEWTIKESALHQVIQSVDRLVTLSSYDDDDVVVPCLMDAVVPFLAHSNAKFHLLPLVLLRDLLSVSPDVRQLVRSNHNNILHVLLPFVYSPQTDVRACAYFAVLVLTCAPEVWGESPLWRLHVPSMITSTFGLHAATLWPSIKVPSTTTPTTTPISTTPSSYDDDNREVYHILHVSPQDFVAAAIDAANAATSHRQYLHAMYQLTCLARVDASAVGRAISTQIESKARFLQCLHTIPTSWRDQVALASLLHVLALVVHHMDMSALMYILIAMKSNAILPLFTRHPTHQQQYGGGLHVKVLMLLLSMARCKDLVEFIAALVLDTALHDHLRTVFILGDDRPAQVLSLQLLESLMAQSSMLSRWSTNELAPTLVQAVGGGGGESSCIVYSSASFGGKHVVMWALSCLLATHSSFSTAMSANRFVFDRDARVRAMGFRLLLLNDPAFITLAKDAVVDSTECAAVRVQAAHYLVRQHVQDAEFAAKVAAVLRDQEQRTSFFLSPEFVLVCARLVPPAISTTELLKFTSLGYHREMYRRACEVVMGISMSETRQSKKIITVAFQNTWQTVHQGRAIQCIGEILTGLDPVDSTLLPHLHEIYALTDDSIEYVHLLGVAMRVLCRLLDQLSTIDQVEELTLVTKLVEMVHTDRSLLPACHVIHCLSKHSTWKHVVQNAQGESIADALMAFVADKPSNHVPQVALALQSLFEAHETRFVDRAMDNGFVRHCLTRLTSHLSLNTDEIALYCNLLGSLLGHHVQAKQLAQRFNLPGMLSSMWPRMINHQSDPNLVETWLHLLNNYVYNDQSAKQSVVGSSPPPPQSTCLKQLLDHATSATTPATTTTISHTRLTLTVLKSVLLNPDCVLACIKYGYVAKLMGIVGTLVYKHQKNKRNNPCDSVVAHVVAVVANVSFSPDGRAEICRYGALKDVLTDLLATPSLALPTALLLRNLTFTSIAKAQFVQWKPIMTSLLAFLRHENPFVTNFASTAVWSLLHNNQKATTHVVELNWSTHVTDSTAFLTQALGQASNESDRVLLSQTQANLERISQLIECNNSDKDDQLKPLDRLAISLNTKFVRRDSTKNELPRSN